MTKIASEFDAWYSSDEFRLVVSQATRNAYHEAHSDFIRWEKETRDLVNRIHSKKSIDTTKLNIWKKVAREFGFAEKWEHRLSDNLSIMYPEIFTMGLNDAVEPDIVNLISPEHGIEFKTCTASIGWHYNKLYDRSEWQTITGKPAWSKKGKDGTKGWYPHTITAWRNCPFVYAHDRLALANPKEIIFSKTAEDMLNFGENRSATMSKLKLMQAGGIVVYEGMTAAKPKWYR